MLSTAKFEIYENNGLLCTN